MGRIWAIAINTFREAVRDKVLHGVLGFAGAVLLFTLALAELSLDQQRRVVLDVGMASISLFSVVVAVFLGSSLLYKEIERKTLYVILPKPIHRHELLIGKYLGTLVTAGVFVVIMGSIQLWVTAAQFGANATLLEVVRPLVRFISGLPEAVQQSTALSQEARAVRDAFQSARSPGALLFTDLPRACATPIDDFAAADTAQVEAFVQRLRAALQELKDAYPKRLTHWQGELAHALLEGPCADLAALRHAVRERYQGLEQFTPDRMGLGALIRRLCDTAHASDEAWLESVATLLGKMPPTKWREETRRLAELRLRDLAEQLRDLERLRLGTVEQTERAHIPRDGEPLLMKTVDGQRGEISRVIHLSSTQRAAADARAEQIAASLTDVPEADRLAVLALLWERFAQNEATGESNHE